MRRLALGVTIAASITAPAAAIDLDLGVGVSTGRQEDAAGRGGWTVRVCRPETEAERVKIEVGKARAKEHERLALWDREATRDQGEVQDYDVPSKFADAGKIWVQGDAEPKGHEVVMAVLYEGRAKRVFSFDDREAHDVSVKDADVEFACRRR